MQSVYFLFFARLLFPCMLACFAGLFCLFLLFLQASPAKTAKIDLCERRRREECGPFRVLNVVLHLFAAPPQQWWVVVSVRKTETCA